MSQTKNPPIPGHDLINFSLRLFLNLILHCFLSVVTIHYGNEG